MMDIPLGEDNSIKLIKVITAPPGMKIRRIVPGNCGQGDGLGVGGLK